jgi:RNA-directed DNA polymerase
MIAERGLGNPSRRRSNSPDRQSTVDHVQRLQRRLGEAAKRAPTRRFHALYDRIWRADILREAWKRVQRNGGSAGIDEESIAAIRALGEDAFVADLGERLRAGRYRPQAVRRCWIPKANGGRRPLGIPTVRDRVVQAATKLVLEPIFEVDFQDCSYGFRPGRNATQALEVLRVRGARGGNHVLDADIADFFGSLDREVLMKRLMRRISDRRVLRLIRMWLDAGVIEEGREIAMLSGVPQGGVISPLLSNIYLAFLDERWTKQCADLGTLVRYADDFVIMCDTRAKVDEAERRVKIIFQRLKLKLHPEKTRKVEIAGGKAGFDFLGCHLRKRMSGPDLGCREEATLLLAALALDQEHEAGATAREGAHPKGSATPRPPRDDREAQPGAARLGWLLPNRQRRAEVQPDRRLRLAAAPVPGAQAQGAEPATGRDGALDPR